MYGIPDMDEPKVRKSRRVYAPLLVTCGNVVLRALDTGVRILPRREWEDQERSMYATLYARKVEIERDGMVLPRLPGRTLAALLEDPRVGDSDRKRAIVLAVVALADFHRRGFTHGDAMAENVLVDFDAGVARWFDFETVHDDTRPITWRSADDLRALLATCLLRARTDELEAVLRLIVDAYPDSAAASLLAERFERVRRPLGFQLGQAALPFARFREIGTLLRDRPT